MPRSGKTTSFSSGCSVSFLFCLLLSSFLVFFDNTFPVTGRNRLCFRSILILLIGVFTSGTGSLDYPGQIQIGPWGCSVFLVQSIFGSLFSSILLVSVS